MDKTVRVFFVFEKYFCMTPGVFLTKCALKYEYSHQAPVNQNCSKTLKIPRVLKLTAVLEIEMILYHFSYLVMK